MRAKKDRRRGNRRKRRFDKKIKIGILLTGICIAVMLFSLIVNRTSQQEIIGLNEAQYPRVSFEVDGRTMNYLSVYVNQMDIAAMRDTITPVPANGRLQMNIDSTPLEIVEINYKVFSLDGTELYVDNSCDMAQTCELNLNKAFTEEKTELALQIVLKTEEQNYSYYTRIKKDMPLKGETILCAILLNVTIVATMTILHVIATKTAVRNVAKKDAGRDVKTDAMTTVIITDAVDNTEIGGYCPQLHI